MNAQGEKASGAEAGRGGAADSRSPAPLGTGKASAPARPPLRPLIERSWGLVWGLVLGLGLLAAAGGLHVLEILQGRVEGPWHYHAAELGLWVAGATLTLLTLVGFVQKAREDERRVRDIVEYSTNAFYSHTPDHELTYVSPRIKDLVGVEPEEAPLRWTGFATDSELNARGMELTQRAIETGRPQPPYELELQHADGHLIRVQVNEAPVVRDGKVVSIVGSLTDITELRRSEARRREVEEQLRQAQKMRAVGELTGGIAHDFNNHLTVIQGNASLLADGLSGEEGEMVREIGLAAERSREIVRKLLAFARQERLRVERVDLADFLNEYEPLVRRIVPPVIEVHREDEAGVPPVRGDIVSLGQVLLNLVTNARDAMPYGGRLGFGVGSVTLHDPARVLGEEIAPGRYAVIRVADTGRGIPEALRERVFDPFFTTKRDAGRTEGAGTGLGLSMVHGLVRQQGGYVRLESEEGVGTTVEILLPEEGTVSQATHGAESDAATVSSSSPSGALTLDKTET